MEELKFIMNNFQVITAVVTVASVLANFTKTEVDNKIVGAVSKVLNILALNFNLKKQSNLLNEGGITPPSPTLYSEAMLAWQSLLKVTQRF